MNGLSLLAGVLRDAGATTARRGGKVARLSDPFDCQACGRCCFGKREHVQVFAHDAETLGAERTARLVAPATRHSVASPGRPSEPEPFMKMVDGHCIALEISEDRRYACSVYEVRPTICRAFQVGSASCLETRAAAGLSIEPELSER